ncbi:MAG TPA: ABC transporter substrate-binding protein [Stellaceae bacterium]|nr:ABC transporter substrate-binding protein [Stellaceae bacterium]
MQPILRRVAFAAFLFSVPGAVSATPPASAATHLTVGTAHATADAELPATVGVELGFFKQHGLDIKLADLGGDSRVIQAMTAGSIDIGVGGATGMALIAKGAPVVAVCEDSATQPYFAIAVPWDSPLHSLKELKGKKIGITRENSTTDWLARQLAHSQGWPPDAITRVAIGGDPAASLSALRQHLVDADMGGTMDFATMEDQKVARILAPVSDYLGKVASGVLYATNHLAQTDPGAIRAYIAAWLETTSYMTTHKDETVKIEAIITHYAPRIVAKAYDIDTGMFTPDCRFDAESVEMLKQSFVDLKLLPTAPDMSKLYTMEFLPKR